MSAATETHAVETIQDPDDVQVIDVTPDLAQYWLGRNTANRKLKPTQIEAYARDMREGRPFDNKWLTLAETPEVVPGFCLFLRFVDPVDGPSRVLQTTHVTDVREVQVA